MNAKPNITGAPTAQSITCVETRLAVWRQQLVMGLHQLWPTAGWLVRSHALVQRFARIYQHLRRQPRHRRRRPQRRLGASFAGAALALTLVNTPTQALPRAAANAQINGSDCDLSDAIIAANTNAPNGACNAGNAGADTITLLRDVALTTGNFYAYFNDTGLPQIDTPITIEGNGYTIRRAISAPDLQRMQHDAGRSTRWADEARFRLMAVGASGDLTLNNTTLSNGYANNWNGGAVYNRGILTLNNSTFSGNRAAVSGGAIYNRGGTVSLTAGTLANNRAYSGGGGGLFNAGGTVTVASSTLSGNRSSNAGGGGLYNNSGGLSPLAVSNSTFSDNQAEGSGGGGAIRNVSGVVTVSNSTLSNNDAGYGGGIQNGDQLIITNSTLSGNSATDSNGGTGAGGGIASSGSVFQVDHSTFTGNSAISGGGIAVIFLGVATLERSLISGNSAGSGAEIYSTVDCLTAAAVSICRAGRADISTDAFNLFGHSGESNAQAFSGFTPAGSDITATSDGTKPTVLAAILNSTLADNGGPTTGAGQAMLTHALVAGSPAIDSGGDSGLDTDQRGVARPQSIADDIGAVEVKVINNSVTPGATTTSNNPTPQPCAATNTNLAIYTIAAAQQNSSASTFTDLFFRVKTLEYTANQGGLTPSLCNATLVVNNGGVGSLLVIPNSSLPGDDHAFNPGETLIPTFQVGRPVAAQFRIRVDLLTSTAAAADAGNTGEQYLGSFDYIFDPTTDAFTPVQQIFLPLVNR